MQHIINYFIKIIRHFKLALSVSKNDIIGYVYNFFILTMTTKKINIKLRCEWYL